MMRIRVVVIGAGTVGCPAAILLARLGYRVTLLDAKRVLCGANMVAAIHHVAGAEYPKDRATARDCVLGGTVARLMFPPDIYTPVAGPEHPVRFFLSRDSVQKGVLTVDECDAQRRMSTDYYRELFDVVRTAKGWGRDEAAENLDGLPETFFRPMGDEDYDGVNRSMIHSGYSAAGRGVSAPRVAAVLEEAVRASGVVVYENEAVTGVERRAGHEYVVRTAGGKEFGADHVIVTASHNSGEISSWLGNPNPMTYTAHLNAAVYVRMPVGVCPRIDFTMIGDDGGMLAFLECPKPGERALAILYHPSEVGNQYRTCQVDPANGKLPPPEWDDYLRHGLPDGMTVADRVLSRLSNLYPILEGAEVSHVIARSVVNPLGRVREIRRADHPKVYAPGVFSIVGTKWTNSAYAALEAVCEVERHDAAMGRGRGRVPVFAGYKVDPAAIPDDLTFRDILPTRERIERWAKEMKLPSGV